MKKNVLICLKAVVLSLFFSAIFFTACQVGLGESVDTEAPKLAITYPPENAVIRSGFVLAGTCSDDGNISNVKVTLSSTSTGATYGPYNATVESKKNWKVTINSFLGDVSQGYNGYAIPDGTYTANVTITDDGGHSSGPFSRQFDIDNTAPVFVISSPQVLKSNAGAAKAYGSTLKVSGTLADSHSVKSMTLNIFDDAGSVSKGTFREENIETTGGTNVSFAKYIKGNNNTYSQRYTEIYGPITNNSGATSFTSQIFVEDSAKEYTNPEEGVNTSAGNTTSVVYLYDDIYSALMSSAGSGLGLEVAQFIGVLNGTSSLDDATKLAVKTYLDDYSETNPNGKKKDTAKKKEDGSFDTDNYLKFSLNPNAAPTYVMTGMGLADISTTAFSGAGQAARGSKLSAQVSLSTNQTNLNPASFKTWIRSIANDKTAVDSLIDKATLYEAYVSDLTNYITLNPKANTATIEKDTNWILMNDNSSYSSGSVGENYTYPIDVDCGINANSCYIVAVTGEDVDGSSLIPSLSGTVKAYGFVGGQGQPPVLTEFKMKDTSKNSVIAGNGYSAGSDYVSYYVVGTSNNGKMQSVEYEVKVSDSANSNTEIGTVKYSYNFTDAELVDITGTKEMPLHTIIESGQSAKDKYGNDITDRSILKAVHGDGLKEYQYALKTTIYDSIGMRYESSANSTLYVDTVKPVFNITSISPIVEKTDSNGKTTDVYLNGTVTMSGSVTETNLTSVKYELYLNDVHVTALDGELSGGRTLSQKIRTSRLLLGSLVGSEKTYDFVPDGKTFKIKLIATDIVGNESYYESTTYNIDGDHPTGLDFTFNQSTDKPVITVADGDVSGTDKQIANIKADNRKTTSQNVTANVTDDDGLKEVKITLYKENGEEEDSVTSEPNGKISRQVIYPLGSVKEGIYGVEVTAKDVNCTDAIALDDLALTTEQQTALSAKPDPDGCGAANLLEHYKNKILSNRTAKTDRFYIVVDNGAPKVTADNASIYMEDGKVTITGTVTETNGIKTLTVGGEVLTKGDTANEDGKYWVTDATNGVYRYKKIFDYKNAAATEKANYINGSREFEIVATDVAETTSAVVKVNVSDEKAPLITEAASSDGKNTIEFTGGTITLSGTITEKNGIESVTIDGVALTPGTEAAAASGTYWPTSTAGVYGYKKVFSESLDGFIAGKRTYEIKVVDIAGKQTTLSPVASDTTAPAVTETTATAEYITGESKFYVNKSRNSNDSGSEHQFTVAGTITEINGIKSVTVHDKTLTLGQTANVDGTYWVTDAANDKYGYKYTFITDSNNSTETNYLADGTYAIAIKATDKVGNEGKATVNVVVDTVPPVITPTVRTAATNGWYKVQEITFGGTASDTNGTGVEGVYYTLDNGTSWTKLQNTTNWSQAINGFIHQTTSVKFKVKDYAGNETISNQYGPYNIDIDEPVLGTVKQYTFDTTYKTIESEIPSNGNEAIKVRFEVKDETGSGSGVSGIYENEGENKSKVYISTSKNLISEISQTPPVDQIHAEKNTTATGFTSGYTVFDATLPKAKITRGPLYVYIFDKAGNYVREQLTTLDVDDVPPTVTINAITNADATDTNKTNVNGSITFTGTANDTKKFNKVTGIYYSKTAPAASDAATMADWVTTYSSNEIEMASGKDGTTWESAAFATTGLTDETNYYFVAVALDDAGNTGYSAVTTLYVNQGSDRPVVKISNLESNGATLMYGDNSSITGTVSDDDSTTSKVVETFFVTSGAVTAADATGITIAIGTGSDEAYNVIKDGKLETSAFKLNVPSTSKVTTYAHKVKITETKKIAVTTEEIASATIASAYDITVFNPKTGEWTFYPYNISDGAKNMHFLVKDNNSTSFYTTNTTKLTGSTTGYARPQIGFKSNNATDMISAASYKSDSVSPGLSSFSLYYCATDSSTDSDWTEVSNPGTTLVVGGESRKFLKFKATAKDANGIRGMNLVLSDTGTGNAAKTKKYNTGTAADTASFIANTTDVDCPWETKSVDISSWATGSCTAVITYYDQSGLYGNSTYTFVLDNTGPTIKVTSPANNSEQTGVISLVGSSVDAGDAGTVQTYWMVPKTTQKDLTEAQLKNLALTEWQGGSTKLDNRSSVVNWEFELGGSSGSNPALTTYNNSTYATADANGIYSLPVYFMAVDSLGNKTVKKDYVIKHNPDGDKPKVEFTYPSNKLYEGTNQFVTLGGRIIVTGSAVVPSNTTTVYRAYIQIAEDTGFTTDALVSAAKTKAAATYDKNDSSSGYGYTVVTAYDVINEILGRDGTTGNEKYAAAASGTDTIKIPDGILAKTGFATTDIMDKWWGIRANGTASWNVEINTRGELNYRGADNKTHNITIRSCAVNAEGKFGAWTSGDDGVIAVHIDNKAPTVTASVNQYASDLTQTSLDAAGTETGTEIIPAYTSSTVYDAANETYLKGKWYLVINILDESGIKEENGAPLITVTEAGLELTAGTGYFRHKTTKTVNSEEKKGYNIYIPISDQLGNTVTYKVSATDADAGNPHTSETTYTFKIDNTAPTLSNIKGNSEDITEANKIVDDKYVYTISGDSTDDGSGFERALFYFYRPGKTTSADTTTIGLNANGYATNPVVIDPMITTSTDDAKTTIARLAASTITQKDGNKDKKYTVYGKQLSGTITAGTFTPSTAKEVTDNAHIRIGGLVLIDGIYRKITSKESSGAVSFTPATTLSDALKTANFIYGQVVDNTSTESVSDKTGKDFTFSKGDDGDGMPESISKTSTTWSWDATIHSTNMPDGPVTLVIIAFDKAGNVSGVEKKTFIANNAPRLAKVFFGTDLNKDGKYSNTTGLTEIVEYNILGVTGENQLTCTIDFDEKDAKDNTKLKYSNGKFKIKKGLAVIPEIVGGNTNIAMVFDKAATTAVAVNAVSGNTDPKRLRTTTIKDISATSDTKTLTGDVAATLTASDKANSMYGFTIGANELGDDAASAGMSFTFWDATDETVQGTGSQNAVLYVKNFVLAQTDKTVPKAGINKFFWNSKSENSIVKNGNNLEGHIEIESDWLKASGYTANSHSGITDNDPKVSGKVIVTGTAYDDTCLGSLWLAMDKTSASDELVASSITSSGTYFYNSGDATTTTAAGHKYYKVATYNSASGWSTETDATHGWTFSIENNELSQNGHTVTWMLVWDTSKITVVAAEDLKIRILALDARERLDGNSQVIANSGNASSQTGSDVEKTTWSAVKATGYDYYTTNTSGVLSTVAVRTADGVTATADSADVYSYKYNPVYKVDVVPYVTGAETKLYKALKSSIKGAYYRSSLGHYIVRSDETVEVSGYNLSGAKYNTDTTSLESITDNSVVTGVKLPASKVTTSGKIVLKVNGIEILNNTNNNDSCGSYNGTVTKDSLYAVKSNYAYNRQPNQTSNNMLTDDFEFDVWQFNSAAAVPVSGELREPVVRINPRTGKVGFAFVSGPADFSMSSDKATVSGNTVSVTGNSYAQFQHNYATFSNVSFVYDSLGNAHGTTTGLDTYPESASNKINQTLAGRFTYVTGKWGPSLTTDMDDNYKYNNKIRLDAIGVPMAGTYNGRYFYVKGSKPSTYTMTETRFLSPSIAATVHNNKSSVYIAYYDSVQSQIRFRHCSEVKDRGNSYNSADSDDFVDNKGMSDELTNGNEGSKHVFESYTENFSLLAGKDYQRKADGTNIGNEDSITSFFDTGFTAGKYVAIDAVATKTDNTAAASNDVVVAVWYDGSDCWYAYTTDPTSKKDVVKGTSQPSSGWSDPVKIFSDGGEFCTVKLAPKNNNKYSVHIAANVDGALKYAYLDNYDSTYAEANSVVVDSYAVTGERITIDVGLKTVNSKTVAVPSISYYMGAAKLPVLATLVIPSDGSASYTSAGTGTSDGSDLFTSNWNVCTVPSPSKVTNTNVDKINVALYKNYSTGLIQAIPYTAGGTATGSSGNCYGNNTANPIIGYAIESTTGTCLETAQLK